MRFYILQRSLFSIKKHDFFGIFFSSSYLCNIEFYKQTLIMEQTYQTISITVPSSDVQFIRKLSKRMGWKTHVSRTKKTGLQLALEDVKAMRVTEYATPDECFNALGI